MEMNTLRYPLLFKTMVMLQLSKLAMLNIPGYLSNFHGSVDISNISCFSYSKCSFLNNKLSVLLKFSQGLSLNH